jgi:hypothetical protein
MVKSYKNHRQPQKQELPKEYWGNYSYTFINYVYVSRLTAVTTAYHKMIHKTAGLVSLLLPTTNAKQPYAVHLK